MSDKEDLVRILVRTFTRIARDAADVALMLQEDRYDLAQVRCVALVEHLEGAGHKLDDLGAVK